MDKIDINGLFLGPKSENGKFFKENTLMNQDFIKDSKKTISAYLKETDKDLTVIKFARLAIG